MDFDCNAVLVFSICGVVSGVDQVARRPNFSSSLGLFGVTFLGVCMTLKWLTPAVDSYVKRRGWRLK